MQPHVDHIFDNSVAVTVTRDSTNILKVGTNRGRGNPTIVETQITETFATLTSLKFQLFDSTDGVTFSTKSLVESDAILAAALVAGAKPFQVTVPPTHKAYLKLTYTVAGTTATAGKVFSQLISAPGMVP